MPRKDVPLTVGEQRFVIHYIREGAAPEVAAIAERKARLPKGDGPKMLKRRHVQEEIHRRKILIEYEENRLVAKDNVGRIQREEARDLVTLEKIEAALDKVIALDAKDHGPVVLKGIELGLIYTGSIRDGNKVKIQTIDPLGTDKPKDDATDQPTKEDGFYRSIFAGLRGPDNGGTPAQVEPAPLMPADDKPKPPPTIPVAPPIAKVAPKPVPAKPKKNEAPQIEIT